MTKRINTVIPSARHEPPMKPCPWCGKRGIVRVTKGVAWCAQCCTTGGTYKTNGEAIAAWNRRAGEADAINQLVAALEDTDQLWKRGIINTPNEDIDRIKANARALIAKHRRAGEGA